MLRISQLLKGPQGLVFGFCSMAAIVVAGPQQAQAVAISFTSAELPQICSSGTCQFDVITTSPINYTQLNTAYPPTSSPINYNYNFNDTLVSSAFAKKYQFLFPFANSPNPANDGNVGFGEIPTTPSLAGGPLFLTGFNTSTIPGVTPPSGTSTATGQYWNTASSTSSANFASTQGGFGLLSGAAKQNQVWAVYKCTSGSCIPVPSPLPILGASAAFGYSRRLRNRLQGSKA